MEEELKTRYTEFFAALRAKILSREIELGEPGGKVVAADGSRFRVLAKVPGMLVGEQFLVADDGEIYGRVGQKIQRVSSGVPLPLADEYEEV